MSPASLDNLGARLLGLMPGRANDKAARRPPSIPVRDWINVGAAGPQPKFLGFDQGGHTWIGHDDEVLAEIVKLLDPLHTPRGSDVTGVPP